LHLPLPVYGASASKQSGTAFDVDDVGVGNVVLACKAIGACLVLISALAFDRPNSKSCQITNTVGGYVYFDQIVDAKYNGEAKAREILGKNNYVIIRPGVLLSGNSKNGANDIRVIRSWVDCQGMSLPDLLRVRF
jgi:dTDP-4-dehydrorhamnose reductase